MSKSCLLKCKAGDIIVWGDNYYKLFNYKVVNNTGFGGLPCIRTPGGLYYLREDDIQYVKKIVKKK